MALFDGSILSGLFAPPTTDPSLPSSGPVPGTVLGDFFKEQGVGLDPIDEKKEKSRAMAQGLLSLASGLANSKGQDFLPALAAGGAAGAGAYNQRRDVTDELKRNRAKDLLSAALGLDKSKSALASAAATRDETVRHHLETEKAADAANKIRAANKTGDPNVTRRWAHDYLAKRAKDLGLTDPVGLSAMDPDERKTAEAQLAQDKADLEEEFGMSLGEPGEGAPGTAETVTDPDSGITYKRGANGKWEPAS